MFCSVFLDLPELLSVSWLSLPQNDERGECFSKCRRLPCRNLSRPHTRYLSDCASLDLLRMYNNIKCTGDEGEISISWFKIAGRKRENTIERCNQQQHYRPTSQHNIQIYSKVKYVEHFVKVLLVISLSNEQYQQ